MGENISILYVEDEANIRDEMLEILELEFENIYVGKNGEEGLQIYKKYTPNLVISDIQMPVLDGISMSKEIMTLNPDVKIILITAFNEKSFVDDAKEIGIEEYVNKPVKINKLFESIERCIK